MNCFILTRCFPIYCRLDFAHVKVKVDLEQAEQAITTMKAVAKGDRNSKHPKKTSRNKYLLGGDDGGVSSYRRGVSPLGVSTKPGRKDNATSSTSNDNSSSSSLPSLLRNNQQIYPSSVMDSEVSSLIHHGSPTSMGDSGGGDSNRGDIGNAESDAGDTTASLDRGARG